MSDFHVVPFEADKHGPFLFDSFRQSVRDQFPWSAIPARVLLDDLKRHLAGGARAVVAVSAEDPDNYLAWLVADPAHNVIVSGFTKHAYRQRFGIGSTLALAAGVDLTRRTGVRYWTRAAERISRKSGWHLYARVTDDAENDNGRTA